MLKQWLTLGLDTSVFENRLFILQFWALDIFCALVIVLLVGMVISSVQGDE